MYELIRPLLFKLPPEFSHNLVLRSLKFIPKFFFETIKPKPVKVFGLDFINPIGLAAGFDKDGRYFADLAKLGFGFIEIGTITPEPQKGNPKPRLFRVPLLYSLINRMGFNNDGVNALVSRLEHESIKINLGINIGKNKNTSLNDAARDYLYCLKAVYPFASYVTINISSPNTKDLRLLAEREYFSSLLRALHVKRLHLADIHKQFVPLVVKLSPDEDDDYLKYLAQTCLKENMDGIIVSNTTIKRALTIKAKNFNEIGGLSGHLLFHRSTECLAIVKSIVGEELDLIGTGGIMSGQNALEKFKAGAKLIQLYTGLVYNGPKLLQEIRASLDE